MRAVSLVGERFHSLISILLNQPLSGESQLLFWHSRRVGCHEFGCHTLDFGVRYLAPRFDESEVNLFRAPVITSFGQRKCSRSAVGGGDTQ